MSKIDEVMSLLDILEGNSLNEYERQTLENVVASMKDNLSVFERNKVTILENEFYVKAWQKFSIMLSLDLRLKQIKLVKVEQTHEN